MTSLLRPHAALRLLADMDGPTGLTLTWYNALFVVSAAPGRRLGMSELG
ncbi:MAG TPA: hypothetical protein VF635_08135 [Propionibacteriaceae bacterium]